jgi:hypothetical protein
LLSIQIVYKFTKNILDMALPLLAIPALAQAAVGGIQWLSGQNRANNLQRPTRQTSQAVLEGVATSKYGAQAANRPGAAMAREQIASSQAGAVSQIGKAGGSAVSALGAAVGAQQETNRSMQQQDIMDAQYRQQMQTQYLQQLENLAREQAANWQWNEAQKFQEEAGAARRQQESGLQNLFGGATEATGLGFMQKMGYLEGADTFGDLFSGGKKDQAMADQNQLMEYLKFEQQNKGVPQINMPNIYSPIKLPTPRQFMTN